MLRDRLRAKAPRWLFGLPWSIALHLAVAVTAVAFLRAEPTPSGLVVELSGLVAERQDEAARGETAPRGSLARTRPPSEVPRAPAPPASAPASTPPDARRVAPAAPRPVAPAEAPAPEPARPPVVARDATASSGAGPAASPAPPSIPATAASTGASGREGGTAGAAGGSGTAADAGTAGAASGAGAGLARGMRNAAGDRVASIAPGGDGGPGSDYGPYQSRLRQRIQESLRYPPAARRRGVSGTVQLEIAVELDGSIGAVTVVASSSHDVLDRAAVNAVRALPRMPFPPDVRPTAFTVRLPVVFDLQER